MCAIVSSEVLTLSNEDIKWNYTVLFNVPKRMKLLDERHVKCKYFIIKSTVLFARKANFAAEQQSLGQF